MSRTTGAVALAGALACAIADAAYLGLLGGDGADARLLAMSWVVFGVVLAGLALARAQWRPSLRRPVAVIVLAAALVQVPGLLLAPLNSSDAYRYVWDGRVQLSGVSPYRMAPLDDRLAGLRDPVLFPGLGPADHTGISGLSTDTADDPRTRINRPECRPSTHRSRSCGSPGSRPSRHRGSAPSACGSRLRWSPSAPPRC